MSLFDHHDNSQKQLLSSAFYRRAKLGSERNIIWVITHSKNAAEMGSKLRSFWLQSPRHGLWLSHLSLNCHMAQASSAREISPPSSPTCSPRSRTWWQQARQAAWRAAAKTRFGILECGTRYASERKNSWWTVGEWIFLCKGSLERGGKRVGEKKNLFIKKPQLIRSLLAFWI